MQIDCVVTGALDENCYILTKNNTCLIVDPGDDYPRIREKIGDKKVLGILITHSHFDHVGALRNFLTKRSIKIFKKSIVKEQNYEIGDFSFMPIYTPGHASDLVTFYFPSENIMFDGDFIFKNNIGRCDLPGGSKSDMKNSLTKIMEYPKEIILYPGHGEKTTLEEEIKNNIYLKEL